MLRQFTAYLEARHTELYAAKCPSSLECGAQDYWMEKHEQALNELEKVIKFVRKEEIIQNHESFQSVVQATDRWVSRFLKCQRDQLNEELVDIEEHYFNRF
jgi:hypothetical protein